MKKLSSIICLFLFGALLFSEQPFFLQNWIIPDDFIWSNNESLPYVPGKRFSQRMSSNYDNSYITFKKNNFSNIDFPPYFEENNLLSWNKTYEEIMEAFKDNPLFFTYNYVYPYHHPERPSDEIEFLDIIRIVCRQENHFELEIYFPHKRTQEERNKQKGSYCYLYYFKDGLNKKNLHRPQKETFESEYKKLWEKNSDDEKKIIALSYFNARDYDYHPLKYDCTLMMNNSIADPAERLKSTYKITSKAELLNYIQTVTENHWAYIYDELKKDLEDNPDRDLIELGIEKNYSVPQISRLFFVNSMQTSIGRHGVLIFEKLTHLFILRLGVGAGFITREESLEYGLPIANQILKEYVSWKDLAAHLAASHSFIGVTMSNYGSWPVKLMKFYNDVALYFPPAEIHFDGSEADQELLFDDAYYKPSGQATWWAKIQSEYQNKNGKELSAVKYIMFQYGKVPCLEALIPQIRPVKYDASKNKDTIAFFNKNYKEIWEKLPENEKYAIALSSNLFELNRQYLLDFDGRVILSDNSSDPKELLKDSWGIENYEQLVEMFNSLEESGHSGAYQKLSEILDKYPEKTPLEIAALENFSMLDTSRLHFVKDTRELLGSHGIEAWDEGREITILRWGVASGYISSDEAMTLMELVIKRIRRNYSDFEDYISHYIMGRQFYALYDGDYEMLGERAKAACYSARAFIPFEFLMFNPDNADTNKKMTYSDCIFLPSEDFKKWESVMRLYRLNVTRETIEQIKRFEKEMPEGKNLLFYWHISLLNHFAQYEELIQFAENNMSYIERLQKDEDVYSNSIFFYINALNQVFKPEEALSIYKTLPESLQGNAYLYYQYAYANYLMINLSNDQKKMNLYRNRAASALRLLKEYNCNIGPQMEGWLLFAEGKNNGAEQNVKIIPEDSDNYSNKMLAYFDELIENYQPEIILSLYKKLPQNLQNDQRFYYDYGYANYLMAFKCLTLIEKDIYNSRAADAFTRLKAHGFELNDFLNCWLSSQ